MANKKNQKFKYGRFSKKEKEDMEKMITMNGTRASAAKQAFLQENNRSEGQVNKYIRTAREERKLAKSPIGESEPLTDPKGSGNNDPGSGKPTPEERAAINEILSTEAGYVQKKLKEVFLLNFGRSEGFLEFWLMKIGQGYSKLVGAIKRSPENQVLEFSNFKGFSYNGETITITY